MFRNSVSFFPTNLITSESNFKLDIEYRIKSHLFVKITLILCGTIICTVYWALILFVRIRSNDLKHNQYKLFYYFTTYTWSLFIQPYVIFAFFLSIYCLLIMLDDIGFLQNDISNHMYKIFDRIASAVLPTDEKIVLINYLEKLQYDFSCCGANSYMNWLRNKHSLPMDYLKTFDISKYTGQQLDFDPWRLKENAEFLPFSCCDRDKTVYCSMEILNPITTLDFDQISQIVPVYTRDCITSITLQITSELNSMAYTYSVVNISLHLLQLIMSIKTYEIISPHFPCKKWFFRQPEFNRNLTPPSQGSIEHSTGSITHKTGSITHVDGSRTHHDGSVLTVDGEKLPKPRKLIHRSGSITDRKGNRIHRTGSKTHKDGSRTHRTGSRTYADGSRRHRDGTLTLGPYDTRQDCMTGRKVSIFYGPAGYISTSKLLEACQNFHLYAKPSEQELNDFSSKVRKIEKELDIGWILKDSVEQHPYAIYVPRLNFKVRKLKYSHKFRYYLRNRLPLLEALLYADGNDLINTEANYLYRSYLIFILRAIIFLTLGYLASLLIFAITNNIPSTNALLAKDKQRIDAYNLKYSWMNTASNEDALKIMEIIEKQTKMCITITLMVGALISLRVRCLLFLIIPTFGLVIGQIYFANQLIYTTFFGPLTSSEYNMKSAGNILNCLSELAYNVSRDFNKLNYIDPTEDNITKSSADVILSQNQQIYPPDHIAISPSLLDMMHNTGRNLSDAIADYENSLPLLNNLTEDYKALTDEFINAYPDEIISALYKTQAIQLSNEMKQRLDKKVENYIANAKVYSRKRNLSKKPEDNIDMDSIFKNVQLEYEMLNNLIHTCMIMHERKFASCLDKSKTVCEDLMEKRDVQGVWLDGLCGKQFVAEEFCEALATMQSVRKECAVDIMPFDLESGLGSYLEQSYEVLKVFNSSMKAEILVNESQWNQENMKWEDWTKENIYVVQHVSKSSPSTMDALFYFLLLLTTLLRLSFVLLVYQAHKYISNYLLNVNFDNLYSESTCELIDQKRSSEDRQTLFPLKSSEKALVLWSKFGYTWVNLKKALFSLFLVLILGSVLICLFYLDQHVHYLINLLNRVLVSYAEEDEEIQEEIKSYTDAEGTYARVTGSGLFKEMVNKLLTNIGYLTNINLDYEMDQCTVQAYETNPVYMAYFYSLWIIFIILSIASIALLRIRHRIVKFFYPAQTRRRAVALYNYLLTQRHNQLTKSRHQIIHRVRLGRLQEEVELLAQPPLLARWCPQLAYLFGVEKVTCLICHEQFQPNPDILMCPIDNAAYCRPCMLTVIKKENMCIACLDRNPKHLFKERRKIQRMLNP
uniref:Dendritic cell-specific transmembrane protein-like domain-containing protein n=1 Tax=Trichobilharzia regenti TaxID=157069 RepID=A0AA85JRX8_TRIRE|nr:unnamed protein product [Trichobilharzia regenti]